MSKPLFRKTATEFTKTDVVDVLLISGLAIVTWELGRRIRNAKRALFDARHFGDLKWEGYMDDILDDEDDLLEDILSDEPIDLIPTDPRLAKYRDYKEKFMEPRLVEVPTLNYCDSVEPVIGYVCIKPESHDGKHIAEFGDGTAVTWESSRAV